jgi:hypothetical protein
MAMADGIQLTILVKGRPITEYAHQGLTFVEGRAGSEYEIEVRNHTWQRVEAVLSVDGLSVIDGKPAGNQSQGYLIESRGVIRIPGWMLNAATVAKFAFSATEQSYTSESGGDTKNNGVIGAMVFREKVSYPYPVYTFNSTTGTAPNYLGGITTSGSMDARPRGITSSGSMADTAIASTIMQNCAQQSTASVATPQADTFVQQSLGTAFGESSGFATRTVSFERGVMLTTLLCYYDNAKGLRARGIQMPRRSKPKPKQPQAFPLTHCQPPQGWKG